MAQSMDFCEDCGDMIDAAYCGLCPSCYDKREEEKANNG